MTNIIEDVTSAIQSEETPVENAAVEQESAQAEDEQEAVKAKEDDPFPSKARNAIARRDRKIGRLTAEATMLRQELERLRTAPAPKGPPTEDQFENYGDFLEAKVLHKLEAQKQPQQETPPPEPNRYGDDVDPEWVAEREEYTATKASEYINLIPDYQEVFMANMDLIDALPPKIEKLFLEADDGALAFYTLAKEGKISAFRGLSEARAALEIASAEKRGASYLKPKTVSKAPSPIAANKGSMGGINDADRMSADDLLKLVKQR